MVLWFYCFIVLWFYGFMVYGLCLMVLWFYGFMVLLLMVYGLRCMVKGVWFKVYGFMVLWF